MSQINPEELFGFTEYERRLRDLDKATVDFGSSTISVMGRIKQTYDQAQRSAASLYAEIENLSGIQRSNGQVMADYAAKADAQAKKLEDSRQAVVGLTQAQEINKQLVRDLTDKLADLKSRYDALDPSQKGYAKAQRDILNETKTITRAIDAQGKSLTGQKNAINAVEGSYAKLSKETNDMRTRLKQMPGAFDEVTGHINKTNKAAVDLQKQIDKNARALANADAQMGQYGRNVGNYSSALKGIGTSALLSVGGLFGISSGLDAIQKGFQAISDMERIEASLKAVSKDSADFNQTQEFLIGTSNELGQSYEVLARSYKSLKAATNNTALEGKATQQIFTGLVRAGSALKLSNEEIEGALMAVTQMMSKGRVSAEELRQQLAERLPGAVRLLAEAMGVTEAQLNKMMEAGELLAIDVLPKLANQLDATYGAQAQANAETMAGAWNTLTNEVKLFVAALDDKAAISDSTTFFEQMIGRRLKAVRLLVQSGEWQTLFKAAVLQGPLDITGAGTEARKRMEDVRQNDEIVQQYKGQGLGLREARLAQTKENIANAQDALTTRGAEMNSGNRQYYEDIVKRDTDLLKKLNVAEKELRRQFRKDNEQAEINEERARVVRKEQEAAAELKRQAARKKAQSEQDRKMSEELSRDQAGTNVELQALENQHQDGIVSEQDYLEKRLAITLAGLEKRMAVLRRYHKQETDDYKKLVAEKLEAESDYQRGQLKSDLGTSKAKYGQALATLDERKQSGDIGDLDYVEQRRDTQKKGVEEQLTILKESGQEQTELYKKTYAELAKIDADYYKDKARVIAKAYKEEQTAVRDSLAKIDAEIAAGYENDLAAIQDKYDKLDGETAKKVAKGELSKVEGEAQLHTQRMERLRDENKALNDAYDRDTRLSQALVNQKIADLEKWKTEGVKTPAEIAEAEKQITELKAQRDKDAADDRKKLNKESADNQKKVTKELTDAEIKEIERLKEKKMALWQLSTDLAQTGGDAVFSIIKGNLDKESTQLDKQKENELRLAGDNADARTKIEEEYAKKKAELSYKQAKADREQALFNIAISTAMGVASVLSTGGGTRYADLGISAGILTAFVIATGALQAAAVLAKPLPEFWQGSSYTPEGWAHVGERGAEIQQRRDGSMVYHENPTVAYLGEGDRIYTAGQTQQLIKDWQNGNVRDQALAEMAGLAASNQALSMGRYQAVPQGLTEDQVERAMSKAMSRQPINQTHIDENFTRKIRQKLGSYTEYVNERYS